MIIQKENTYVHKDIRRSNRYGADTLIEIPTEDSKINKRKTG